jgi:transcriptional regulator with XRE-family HTH domain
MTSEVMDSILHQVQGSGMGTASPDREGRPPFGRLLRHWRRLRGHSQLVLATEAGVSTRHLSFLETGRSTPSREMVLRLVGARRAVARAQRAAGRGWLRIDLPADGPRRARDVDAAAHARLPAGAARALPRRADRSLLEPDRGEFGDGPRARPLRGRRGALDTDADEHPAPHAPPGRSPAVRGELRRGGDRAAHRAASQGRPSSRPTPARWIASLRCEAPPDAYGAWHLSMRFGGSR